MKWPNLHEAIPERLKKEGVFISGGFAHIGDKITPVADGKYGLTKGSQLVIEDIILELLTDGSEGLKKRIKLKGIKEDFNPNDFQKL